MPPDLAPPPPAPPGLPGYAGEVLPPPPPPPPADVIVEKTEGAPLHALYAVGAPPAADPPPTVIGYD